jgi:translation initiation factor IF-2
LLEAELLDLKSNQIKHTGTVVEAFLDKGKGYVSILVQEHYELVIIC